MYRNEESTKTGDCLYIIIHSGLVTVDRDEYDTGIRGGGDV